MVTLVVGAVCLVVGGGLGYAFRGKEHAAIGQLGQVAQGVANKAATDVTAVAKKV